MHKLILDTQTLALILASLRTTWFEDRTEAYQTMGRPELDVFNEDTIGELIGELTDRLNAPDQLPDPMPEELFVEYFNPYPRPGDGDLLDYTNVANLPVNRVWTIIEGESGGWYAAPGFHAVDRLGYATTERPWEAGKVVMAEWFVESSLNQVAPDTYQVEEFAERVSIQMGTSDEQHTLCIELEAGAPTAISINGTDGTINLSLIDRKVAQIDIEGCREAPPAVTYS